MTLLASEICLYKSQTITDFTTNGGRRSTTKVVSGAINNLFALVLPADRSAGKTALRKVFVAVDNDDDATLYEAVAYIDSPTTGDDWATFFSGTPRDTVAAHTGAEARYGVGLLAADVAAGAISITLSVEHSSLAGLFADGQQICITDRTIPASSASGNRDFATISGAPVVSGTTVTLTLAVPLSTAYTVAATTRVATCYSGGDIRCSVSGWTATGSGSYDEIGYPVLTDNLGTVEQTWTLTFSSATAYTVTGDTKGAVGSGSTTALFAPVNPATGKPYFTLRHTGFGGTWTAGDTIVFQAHAADLPLWLEWIIPAGAVGVGLNRFTLVVSGYRD